LTRDDWVKGILNEIRTKGKDKVDKDVSQFAKSITDEVSGIFNIPLPESITNGKRVYFTTMMIFRKHLPLRYLHTNWFPLLVKPDNDYCRSMP
jgi:hypothetical protein